jgi:signal transduction histidine kinase
MKSQLVRSRFKGVYAGLSVFWIAICLSVHLLNSAVVLPNIISARAIAVESLLRSNEDQLQYNDSRNVRDELIRQKIISDDRAFSEVRNNSDESRRSIQKTLDNCRFVSGQTCIDGNRTLIFNRPPAKGTEEISFVIALSTQYFTQVNGAFAWETIIFFVVGLIFGLVALAIRQQELFFLSRIGLLFSSLRKIESSFDARPASSAGPNREDDEFEAISKGIAQVGVTLESRTQQIEEYRRKFERKTRMELFAQTVSYASHNLKAPLQEGAEFLRDLPGFIEKMPRETLLRAIRSLEMRLRDGGGTLQKALSATRESVEDAEKVSVQKLLEEFRNRIVVNPGLNEVTVDILSSPRSTTDLVFCSPSEMNAVFWNLLKNSIEAKRDSRIVLASSIDGAEVVVDFKDDGPGIPVAVLDSVFDDFYTTKAQGSGLGLSSVKRSLERARGKIRAFPAQSGVHFQMRFPKANVERGANV